jgi:hypothetical protein
MAAGFRVFGPAHRGRSTSMEVEEVIPREGPRVFEQELGGGKRRPEVIRRESMLRNEGQAPEQVVMLAG